MEQKPERSRDPARIVSQVALGGLVLAAVLGVGLFSGYRQNALFRAADFLKESVVGLFEEAPNLAQSGAPVHFLQPARKEGSGVTVNERADDGRLILISSFFDGVPALRLIRRDGSIVAEWPVHYTALFPDTSFVLEPPATDWNTDIHGVVINPDGSVVFNFEYAGTVKLSRCGETLWTLKEATHHTLERAESGGYWIAGQRYFQEDPEQRFNPFTRVPATSDKPFGEGIALRVSEEGEVLQRISVTGVFYDNGLQALLTAGGFSFLPDGKWEHELIHLNKIAELPSAYAAAFPEFEAGDLLVSTRMQNLLAVFDPDTGKLKWHQTGPWLRQHDPEFDADGTITVFNNNAFRLDLLPGDRTDLKAPRVSNITRVDPKTGETSVAYGQRDGQELYSVIRGKHEPTAEGGFLITEFAGGRAFEVDAAGRTVWEYINRFDAKRVLEITEARSYPADYFTVTDWSCPAPTPAG